MNTFTYKVQSKLPSFGKRQAHLDIPLVCTWLIVGSNTVKNVFFRFIYEYNTYTFVLFSYQSDLN